MAMIAIILLKVVVFIHSFFSVLIKINCDLLIFILILEKETRKSQCYVVYLIMLFTRISSTLQGGW